MYNFAYPVGLLLVSFIISHARHTVFISQNGDKTYLPSSSEAEVCMTPKCVIAAADILTSLDSTVDPCDDFYSFACGGWLKTHEVSEDYPKLNAFVTTGKELNQKLRDLLESEYKSSDPESVKVLKNFYSTCVDLDTLEKQGSAILKKMLHRLGGGWPVVEGSEWDESSFDWADSLVLFRTLGFNHDILLELTITENDRDNTGNYIYLDSPPLMNLNKYDYNLTDGLDDPKIAAYFKMMVKAAKLLGADESTAEKELLEALNFEIAYTNITKYGFSRRERQRTVYTIEKLQTELPQVPWLKIFNGILLVEEVYENETFANYRPDFLVRLVDLMSSTDKRVIANYMLWLAVQESMVKLGKEWVDIQEDWKKDEPFKMKKWTKDNRWKQCLMRLEYNFDAALTSYYIRNYYPDESYDEAVELMKYIQKEFLKLLENNDWMDDKTRKKAEEKANAIKANIGYPKELINDFYKYDNIKNLTMSTDSYLECELAAHKWEMDKRYLKLRQINNVSNEIHRSEQRYTKPLTVNAFYIPWENRIKIPAGILQPVFYDKGRPKYMNFAEIGYVIGHEITHGFDNNGRKFDKGGSMVNWWDEKSDEHFRKKVKCIIDQYDNYTTSIGMQVNGEKTQNENIADNGGLKEAYLAYHSWTKDHGTEPLLPGLDYNQNQLFWLSAARVWCSKYTPENLKKMLVTDTHSPGKFRIIGPMSNLAEFSRDFKCSDDAPMNRKYKCEVW